MPGFKTIADFRKDNGEAIRKVCREFVVLCQGLELFSEASVAIDNIIGITPDSRHWNYRPRRPFCNGSKRGHRAVLHLHLPKRPLEPAHTS
jgi:hypothetical protein